MIEKLKEMATAVIDCAVSFCREAASNVRSAFKQVKPIVRTVAAVTVVIGVVLLIAASLSAAVTALLLIVVSVPAQAISLMALTMLYGVGAWVGISVLKDLELLPVDEALRTYQEEPVPFSQAEGSMEAAVV